MNLILSVLVVIMFYCIVDVYIVYLYIYEVYFFFDGREVISYSSVI